MPSPPRQPRGSPPRQPLSDKSNTQINQRLLPSEFSNAQSLPSPVRGGAPYPTQASQVLSPPRRKLPRGPIPHKYDDYGHNTGHHHAVTPGYGSPKLPKASSLQSSSEAVTDSSRPTGPPDLPPYNPRRLANQDSDTSLESTNSTGTMVKKSRGGQKRISYSAFPSKTYHRPSSSRSGNGSPSSQRSSPKPNDGNGSDRSRSSSLDLLSGKAPGQALKQETPSQDDDMNVAPLQVPVAKQPSPTRASAEVSNASSRLAPQPGERNPNRWNPHLSTVQSEGDSSSYSADQSGRGTWLLDSSRVSKSSSNRVPSQVSWGESPVVPRMYGPGAALSPDLPDTPNRPPPARRESVPDIPATPPPVRQRDFSGATIRIVEESPQQIANREASESSGTGLAATPSHDARPRNEAPQRPARNSFFRDGIPAWAKLYYARPLSTSSATEKRISTATDNISINVFRPHNRQQNQGAKRLSRMARFSGLSMHPVEPNDSYLGGMRNSAPVARRSTIESPHLWRDRASVVQRRSVFRAPSLDEEAEGKSPLTRRNVQILLFALGFICPLTWFVAAVLPLPPQPVWHAESEKQSRSQSQIVKDMEAHFGPIDEARYENARWWRNVNRFMCFAGLAIIIIIVVLAAVAAT